MGKVLEYFEDAEMSSDLGNSPQTSGLVRILKGVNKDILCVPVNATCSLGPTDLFVCAVHGRAGIWARL